jgi:hypothetical protein
MSDHDDAYWDQRVTEAAERAAGFYYEKTKDDFELIFESLDLIQDKIDKLPTRDEFDELKTEVRTIKLSVIDTNKELHGWDDALSNA